ncbi:MAG: hypothetical protein IMY73_00790 [Bacteroidetes bacterium]|nr:hypothetical protein [Bacteroidota bacterium]
MNKILLLLSCLFIVSPAIAQDIFSGRWNMLYYNSNNNIQDYFDITLTQDSTKLTGSHDGVFFRGNRIESRDNSIKGEIKNGVAIITIKSGRTATKAGTAKIEYIGKDSVLFTLIKEPSDGEHMIPKNIILTRDKSYKQK